MKKSLHPTGSRSPQASLAPLETGVDRTYRYVWMLVWIFLIFRLCYASGHELAADETVYWSWSRHLAGGYLDHPSGVAYLIRLSTAIFGSTELGARFFCPVLATAALVIMLKLAGRVLREKRAVVWVGAIWLTSPLLAGLGTIITPDTPSIFFSVCAMACVIFVLEDSELQRPGRAAMLWLTFGALCGLAMLSKYTAVLLPASVGLALLTSPLGRRHLLRPWAWLSAVPAVLVFLPVLLWNQAHDWASFRYQLNHGFNAHLEHGLSTVRSKAPPGAMGFLRYSGAELLLWTPVLLVIGMVVLVHFWRRYRSLTAIDRMLLWLATFPLAFFAYAATRAQSEANWPIFAYFPLSLLTVRWLASEWEPARVGWVRNGCIVALVGLIVVQFPQGLGRVLPDKVGKHEIRPKVMAKLDELSGWRQLGTKVAESLAAGHIDVHASGSIVTEKHQDAGELAFYLPGQPDIWPVGDGSASRAFAFDFFDPKPNFNAMNRIVFVGYHYQKFASVHGLIFDGVDNIFFRTKTGGSRQAHLIFLKKPDSTNAKENQR